MRYLIVVLFVLMTFTAHAADQSVEIRLGSVAADNLGGVGGHKSLIEIGGRRCGAVYCGEASVWHTAEKADDDAGIVPVRGYSLHLERAVGGVWLGARHDRWGVAQMNITLGVGTPAARVSWIIPVATSDGAGRFGVQAAIRAPLTRRMYATAHYLYLGTQDPNAKHLRAGIGLGLRY